MNHVTRTLSGLGLALFTIWIGTVAVSYASDAPVETVSTVSSAQLEDAGVSSVDGGHDVGEEEQSSVPVATSEKPPAGPVTDDETLGENKKLPKGWRRDKSVPRRPGSYLGGSSGVGLGYAWFKTTHRELELDFDLGPMVGSVLAIRVGDAFLEWLTVGFQVNIFSATYSGAEEPKTAAFALLIDTVFYPWRGLGLKPAVGLGFSYGQAGTESFQIAMGGPTTLAFGISYEFRVSRFFTMGPSIQATWTTGDDYNAFYLIFALEFLKWFKTAEG